VDENGTRRREAVDRLHAVADPLEAGWDRGNGDVGTRGTQAPEGMLRASPR
jgi:hypothetical protein